MLVQLHDMYAGFIYDGKTKTSCVGELKTCLSFWLCSKLSQAGPLLCDESAILTNLSAFVFNIVNHSPKYKIYKGILFKNVKLFFMNLQHS